MNIINAFEANTTIEVYTHAGIFHADEVFASAMLLLATEEKQCSIKIIRTRQLPDGVNDDTSIVYDIGGGRFDHHQKGGNGARDNGVPYSSAGLIWKELGSYICGDEVAQIVDERLITFIDAVDNGYEIDGATGGFSVSNVIGCFNPSWKEDSSDEAINNAFDKAVLIAKEILAREISAAKAEVEAEEAVSTAIKASFGGVIVFENGGLPWQKYVLENNDADGCLFVVFPSIRGGYMVQAIPKELGSFEFRKGLPEAWRGLRGEELQKASGIKTATFAHPAGFIGGAETLEDAMLLASSSVAWQE